MLGVAVLIVVLSVHAGFEREVKKLLLGFAPHIEIQQQFGLVENHQELGEDLRSIPGVSGSYAMIEDFVLLDSANYRRPVLYRAVDTSDQEQIKALDELLDRENYPESRADMGLDEYTVISRQLAFSLGLSVGDQVEVFSSRNFDGVKDVFEATNSEPLKVSQLEEIQKLLLLAEEGGQQWETPKLQDFYLRIQALENETGRIGEIEVLENIRIAIEEQSEKSADETFYTLSEALWPQVTSLLRDLQNFDEVEADAEALRGVKEIVLPKSLTVWGVYRDTQRTPGPAMFIPLSVGQELKGFEGGAEVVAVRLDDPFDAYQTGITIQERIGEDYFVSHWMERHQTQFQLIRTERMMMTFALSFIGLISAFSIMAVMYTVTIQKKQEIGVMKALGATGGQISWVFLWQGLFVGFFGAVGGILLALLVIWRRVEIQTFLANRGFDPFPADFQGFELPAEINPTFMTIVALTAWILCGLAALIPAWKAASNDAAKSLRNL